MTTIQARANPAAAADLVAADVIAIHRDGQAGGQRIPLSEFADFLGQLDETYAGGLSGNTTVQATATQLTANKNIATTVTGTNNAFKMPAGSSTLSVCVLFNDDASGSDSLLLFPATGEDIGAGVNAAFTIAVGDWARFEKKSASVWYLAAGTVSF